MQLKTCEVLLSDIIIVVPLANEMCKKFLALVALKGNGPKMFSKLSGDITIIDHHL